MQINFMNTRFVRFGFFLLSAIGLLSSHSTQARPLEIWISSFQDKVYYENMVKLYQQKAGTNFQANIHAYGFREMPDKLAVAIKTGTNPPDIVQLDEVLFGTYLAGEVPFVDLADRVKKAGLDKDILAQRLSLFSYHGKTYGLPQSLSAMLLYYRTDLFNKFDLTPEKLATWEDFVREGERLAEKNQALIALDPIYFEVLLRQQGSDLFDESGKAFPDFQTAVDTLNWIRDLQEKKIGVLPERASIFDPVFFSSTVEQDAVLCIIGADWYGLDMLQQFTPALKGKWGVMPLPAWRKKDGGLGRRTSAFAGQGLLIYKGSSEVEPSWKFIEYVMTDKEANAQRFLQGNSFPAYKPAWKDERLAKKMEFFNNQPLGKILADLGPDVPKVVVNPKRPQAVFMFQESFFSSFMFGQMSAEETLKQMKALLEKP
jgi:ABC-type glycerol-3-phosphate transport system substrate-binding protein